MRFQVVVCNIPPVILYMMCNSGVGSGVRVIVLAGLLRCSGDVKCQWDTPNPMLVCFQEKLFLWVFFLRNIPLTVAYSST